MTPQQRTQAIIEHQQSHAVDSDEMARLIEQAIVAAVAEERESPARIADDEEAVFWCVRCGEQHCGQNPRSI